MLSPSFAFSNTLTAAGVGSTAGTFIPVGQSNTNFTVTAFDVFSPFLAKYTAVFGGNSYDLNNQQARGPYNGVLKNTTSYRLVGQEHLETEYLKPKLRKVINTETNEITSYSEDIRSTIDSSIVDSHNEFVSDTDFLATTGASHAADRDDFLPPVPFYGLPRKAHYMNLGSEKDARVVQSETDMDINAIREHHNTSYIL